MKGEITTLVRMNDSINQLCRFFHYSIYWKEYAWAVYCAWELFIITNDVSWLHAAVGLVGDYAEES